MKLLEIKTHLNALESITFMLPNGELVPNHFHVTEIGKINKHFVDCGGTERKESVINFQLWDANDYDHRLYPEKLLNIIEISERILGLENFDIEVEYQGDTIGKFGLDFDGKNFLLANKKTDCLAKENCGVPASKPKLKRSELQPKPTASCDPNSGCC